MDQELLSKIEIDIRDMKSFCDMLARLAANDSATDSFIFTMHHLARIRSYAHQVKELSNNLIAQFDEHGELLNDKLFKEGE
jgi:ABC-type phosphate/phosphonate transport system ATPase subunit